MKRILGKKRPCARRALERINGVVGIPRRSPPVSELEVLLRRSHHVASNDHHGNSRAGLLGSR